MRTDPDDSNSARQAAAIAEELAQILTKGGWHDTEELCDAVVEACCRDESPEPCRELLRLHAYGRLQNWLQHGFVERDDTRYRAIGEALFTVNNHAAAEHCRTLIETVRCAASEAAEQAAV